MSMSNHEVLEKALSLYRDQCVNEVGFWSSRVNDTVDSDRLKYLFRMECDARSKLSSVDRCCIEILGFYSLYDRMIRGNVL